MSTKQILSLSLGLVIVMVITACADSSPVKPNPYPYQTPTPSATTPTPTPSTATASNAGFEGCKQWTRFIDGLSNGARQESMVRLYFPQLIGADNVLKIEELNERYFSKASEPELREISDALVVTAKTGVGVAVDGTATALTDMCYFLNYDSPF